MLYKGLIAQRINRNVILDIIMDISKYYSSINVAVLNVAVLNKALLLENNKEGLRQMK